MEEQNIANRKLATEEWKKARKIALDIVHKDVKKQMSEESLGEDNEDALWFKAIEFNIGEKDFPVYREKNVKEKVKNAKRRFKEEFCDGVDDVTSGESKQIDKIFLEEFGEKIIK